MIGDGLITRSKTTLPFINVLGDITLADGASIISAESIYSYIKNDSSSWDFFTKTSGAATLSRLRIPSGTDSVNISMANANLLFGSGYGIRANAANGTIVDFEAYEAGAYVTVANMNSGVTAANWTFHRVVTFADDLYANADLYTGLPLIDADSGAVVLADMAVSADPAAGTEESYVFSIDGTEHFKVYTEADSSGGIQNSRLEASFNLRWLNSADSAALTDAVAIGGYDISAGHRAFSLSCEEVVAAETDEAKFSHKLPVRINGSTYNLMLCAT